jgi:hypothetical protein
LIMQQWGSWSGRPDLPLLTSGPLGLTTSPRWLTSRLRRGEQFLSVGLLTSEVGAGLEAVLRHEATLPGLDPDLRCAMVKTN